MGLLLFFAVIFSFALAYCFYANDYFHETFCIMAFVVFVVIYLMANSGSGMAFSADILEWMKSSALYIAVGLALVTATILWQRGTLDRVFNNSSAFAPVRGSTGYSAHKDVQKHSSPATLLGAATRNNDAANLSVSDITAINLTIYALSDFNLKAHHSLGAKLTLSPVFHKAVDTYILKRLDDGPINLDRTLRAFLRETNHNYDVALRVFSIVCYVAIKSGNTDDGTIKRLKRIVKKLKLPTHKLDEAIQQLIQKI